MPEKLLLQVPFVGSESIKASPHKRPLRSITPRAKKPSPYQALISDIRGIAQPARAQNSPVSDELANGHYLGFCINRAGLLGLENFRYLQDILKPTLAINISDKGTLTASAGATHQAEWMRDAVAVSRGVGQIKYQKAVTEALYKICSSPEQRILLTQFLDSYQEPSPRIRYEVGEAPHVKFSAKADGELGLCDHGWGHKQLDAWGYFLQEIGDLARTGQIDINALDEKYLFNGMKPEEKKHTESTVVAIVRYLRNVKYWKAHDLGQWESHWEKSRSTSIGAVISGLESIRRYCESIKWDTNKLKFDNGEFGYTVDQFKADLDHALKRGRETLAQQVNENEAFEVLQEGTEPLHKRTDAALLFLLTLANPEYIWPDPAIREKVEARILEAVQPFEGAVATRRFDGDNYEAAKWTTNPLDNSPPQFPGDMIQANKNGEFAARGAQEAEWPMFNAYKAVILYRQAERLWNSDSKNEARSILAQADKFVRRALATITTKDDSYQRRNPHNLHEFITVRVPAKQVLESLWRDENGKWRPGENYGLNWTKAAYSLMLAEAKRVTKLTEVSNKFSASVSGAGARVSAAA